ncbi:hypothetical protein Bca101_045266 [Brassica carinata]
MGRTPCCDKKGLKKGPWTPEEDEILVEYINKNSHGSWRLLPKKAGKISSYSFSVKWAAIATQLPGRTDNEIKNLWNTHLKKRMLSMGLDPKTHELLPSYGLAKQAPASQTTRHMAQWESARLEAEARLSRESILFNPTSGGEAVKYERDHFLRIWNSEIGESFRNIGVVSTTTSQSLPCSRTTSSSSALAGKEIVMGIHHGSDSSSPSWNNVEDVSSDSALQLLLDFPISDHDMSFLEENIGSSYTESHVGVVSMVSKF